MNNPLVLSEASPLLPALQPPDELNAIHTFPLVEALETADISHLQWEDLTPRTISASLEMDPCKKLAFALIVLLQLRKRKIAWKGRYPADSYEQWTEEEARARDVETLEEKLSELWENFLAQYHGPRDLHDVLWTPFLLRRDKSHTIRVVDFLVDRDAPSKFVAHPIVSMTMSRTWKYGRPENNYPQSMLHNIFSTSATPCKTHFLELIFDLGFMVLLLSYVIRPPNWPKSEVNRSIPAFACLESAREVYIIIYTFSVLISARGANVILSALTLIAFTFSPATLPLPGDLRFYILLWVIFFRCFMYHIPTIPPGPTLLVQHQHSFPLAVFLSQGLIRIIRPLLRFYFPIILVSCLTLSISMSGPLTGPLTYLQAILPTPGSDLPIVGIAPMDTRINFFLLSVAAWLLVLSSAYILGSSTPVTRANPIIFSSSTAWDLYSQEVGHIARITSYCVTVAYADDYPFPPPLSVVKLLLVTIPVGLARLTGNPHIRRVTVARPVWNLTVRPLMMIVAPLCAFLA